VATLRLNPIISDVESVLSDLWLQIAAWMREQNQPADLAQRIDDGLGADAVIGTEDAADRFASDVHDAYMDAGRETARWLDAAIAAALLSFDATSVGATEWAAQNVADVRRAIMADVRAATSTLIADGRNAGRDIETIARDVQGGLGLTEAQAKTIVTYRRALEDGELSSALDRALRDGRSDRTLEQALRDGTTIRRSQIDGMVRRYEMSVLRFRADNLGLFEGSYAVHSGAFEMLDQAVESGAVKPAQLKARWLSRGDDAVRNTHRTLDGQTQPIDRAFKSPSGVSLRYPRDPKAPSSETRGCRCKLELVLE